MQGLPRDRPVITLCHSGNRSLEAARFLRQSGIPAQSLRGGIAAWNRVYDVAAMPIGERGEVVQFRRLGKGCLSYLVTAGGEAAVIDPSWQISQYLDAAASRGARIRAVMDTHLHADHISGARRLTEESSATLYLSPADGFAFGGFAAVREGFTARVGPLVLKALAAPGHTAGSVAWDIAGVALLTGDTLFLESIGRPDLHGQAEAFAHDLYDTLQRLAVLPENLLILPGHYPDNVGLVYGQPHADRLGPIRTRLRFAGEDESAFVERVRRVPERPPNMVAILEINRQGTPASDDEAGGLEEGPNRCAVKTG